MTNQTMQEISSETKIPVEAHFKVSAGPGAGKTHWLISHVKNVLQNSRRLARTAKIACITYTNTGVEEIRARLHNAAERVEVSTIHSFLYNNIVKPYGFLLKDDSGRQIINLRELNGHEEHIPSANMIYRWKRETGQNYLHDDAAIASCLNDLDWQFNDQGHLELQPRRIWKADFGDYSIRRNSYLPYKRLYWNQGRIHHEDVLYFAHRLLMQNPRIVAFLCTKFPYIFIDEFQDTHPIQTAIIRKLGGDGTIVGVIGDAAQSIYRFQGAERRDFTEFSLPEMKDYAIKGNRRSTIKIVDFLNKIREGEIKQTSARGVEGDNVKLLVGDRFDAIEFVQQEVEEVVILARKNPTVHQLRSRTEEPLKDLWALSRSLDSNYRRQELIHHAIYAAELAQLGDFVGSRRKASRLFRKYRDETKIPRELKREYSISMIGNLLENYDGNLNLTITDFNNHLVEWSRNRFDVKIGARITRGRYKDSFADKFTYQDLRSSLRIEEDLSSIKTIHQAKGAQFDGVLIVLDKPEEIKRITVANLEDEDDECRVYYVGLSRARNHLFISVPEISSENREVMEALGAQIHEL